MRQKEMIFDAVPYCVFFKFIIFKKIIFTFK